MYNFICSLRQGASHVPKLEIQELNPSQNSKIASGCPNHNVSVGAVMTRQTAVRRKAMSSGRDLLFDFESIAEEAAMHGLYC